LVDRPRRAGAPLLAPARRFAIVLPCEAMRVIVDNSRGADAAFAAGL
jgi:hypothetical protein